jgi:hypothetical protein
MNNAISINDKGELNLFHIFYEKDEFYFSITVNSNYPFNSPGRMQGNVAYSGDFKQGLEYWAKLMLQKKPGDATTFLEVKNKPGYYYPRIWRGDMQDLDSSTLAGSQATLSKSMVAGDLIIQRLYELFTYIEPIKANQNVHSHKIRELLLLSCMEVESSWTAILKANNYNINNRLSTNDYVKILNPLLLNKYEVEFPMYPEIGIVMPFKDWAIGNPTKSLSWYDAYNSTKHNREENFHHSTLENAISAVSAIAVMLCAQFGPDAVPEGIEVNLKGVDYSWPYIPLARATRNANPDGSTQGIGWNASSTWTQMNYTF